MVQNSVKWNFSDDKCFEIIHLTIIDILSEKHEKILSLNALIENLNSRTKIYKLHNSCWTICSNDLRFLFAYKILVSLAKIHC